MAWSEPTIDVLGEPFTAQTLDLGHDQEGSVVATLVTARTTQHPARGAVLHLHGYNDYFFQTDMAQWWNQRGYDFYAVDLRKYGRSLRPHHTPYFVTDLSQYAPELDEAYRLITERDQHEHLIVQGHSTGGLVAALWVAHRQDLYPAIKGLILNAPWLTMSGPGLLRRRAGSWLARGMRAAFPHKALGRPSTKISVYGSTLHREHRGTYDYNTEWKTLLPRAIRAGWAAAILLGHDEVRRGLEVKVPVLTLTSDRSSKATLDDPDAERTDVVLDVPANNALAHTLGPQAEVIHVPGALHDVFCSRPEARNRAFAEVDGWLKRTVEADVVHT